MYGYLNPTERLEEIIAADGKTLARLGFTHEQFAKTLEDIFFHEPKTIHGHRLIFWDYIHSPLCPWDDFCSVSPFDLSAKVTEIWLCNRKHYWKLRMLLWFWRNYEKRLLRLKKLVEKDWILVLSDLHPHLLREHRFCEDHKTPYRVDPERFLRYMGKNNIYPYIA